ncbi:hypothetical protein MBLNU230_g1483t1 [Neophaeotheca triangularis]
MIVRQCSLLQTRQAGPLTTLTLTTLLPIPPSTRPRPPPLRRQFHTTHPRLAPDNKQTHYQTLSLPPTATDKEIKKQFYALSKTHHPDLHPNDPTASEKFVQISEAYATLGSAEKRAKYDREVIQPQQAASDPSSAAGRGGGSYSSASSGPGGRPASGLSRRRTQYRGPPPSFYRSGGWGQHGSRRRAESEKSSHTAEARGESRANSADNEREFQSQTAGTGPGGFTAGFDNDVPHFDQRGHFQTQSSIERKRQQGRRRSTIRREEDFEYEGGGNSAGFNFVLLMGVLGVIYGVSGVIFGFEGRGGGKGKGKKDEGEK